MTDQPAGAEPVTERWPDWLEGLSPEAKVSEILTAYEAQVEGDADEPCRLTHAEACNCLLRLLGEVRIEAETRAARATERALEAEHALIVAEHNLAAATAAKTGTVQAAGHAYLSTACLHASEPGREHLHGYCGSAEGFNAGGQTWAKIPGRCKFCNAPCTCPCGHESPVSRESGDQDQREPETAPGRSDQPDRLADAAGPAEPSATATGPPEAA